MSCSGKNDLLNLPTILPGKHLTFTHLALVVTFCALLLAGLLPASVAGASKVTSKQYDPVNGQSVYRWCTHLYFNEGKEIAVDLKNSRILYRPEGTQKFTPCSLPLLRPHSIVYNTIDKLYYVSDTDNHRIIAFDSLENPTVVSSGTTIAGVKLERPHDIVFDQKSGWLYAINPLSAIIFRFKAMGKQESMLDLSTHLDYSRALTFSNGKLYVVGSSMGKVVEINDFEQRDFTVYQSPGKVKIAPKGYWQQTGLVLNDVEYLGSYWYASSYFYPPAVLSGQDYNKNKFIRFKTWEQFEKGEWEDLSHLLPDALVPYYLTPHKGHLYITLYNHKTPGKGDCIYQLSVE
jgi:hypothetical protein